jgi:hypothetical protein
MNLALPLLEQRLLLTHVTGLSREQWITREPSLSAEQQGQFMGPWELALQPPRAQALAHHTPAADRLRPVS